MYVIYLIDENEKILRQLYASNLKELCASFLFLGTLPYIYESIEDGLWRIDVKYGDDTYNETDLWHFR